MLSHRYIALVVALWLGCIGVVRAEGYASGRVYLSTGVAFEFKVTTKTAATDGGGGWIWGGTYKFTQAPGTAHWGVEMSVSGVARFVLDNTTPSQSGSFTLRAYSNNPMIVTVSIGGSSGGTGWMQFTLDPAATLQYVTLSLRNTHDYPVSYKLMQDGVEVGALTLSPGQSIIQTFQVPTTSTVTVAEWVNDFGMDGPSWVLMPGAITKAGDVGHATPTPQNPGPTNSIPESGNLPGGAGDNSTGGGGAPDKAGNVGGGGGGHGAIWDSGTDVKANDLLTNATYKQGVDAMLKKTDEHGQKIDDHLKKLDAHFDARKAIDAMIGTLTFDRASIQSASDAAVLDLTTKARDSVQSQIDALNIVEVPDPHVVLNASSPSWPTFTIPLLGTIDTDPYRIAAVRPALLAAREIILWFLVYWYIRYASDKVEEYLKTLMIIPQVSVQDSVDAEVPIWAHLKQAVNAGAILSFIVGFWGVLVGLVNTKIGTLYSVTVSAFVSNASVVTTLQGINSPVAQIFYDSFPLAAAITLLLSRLTLQWAIPPLFVASAALARSVRI